jgi:hypothetical protein
MRRLGNNDNLLLCFASTIDTEHSSRKKSRSVRVRVPHTVSVLICQHDLIAVLPNLGIRLEILPLASRSKCAQGSYIRKNSPEELCDTK